MADDNLPLAKLPTNEANSSQKTEGESAFPLFPLPQVVLFPGQLLPLQIFEKRYLAMCSELAEGSRQLVLARLEPGYEQEYFQSPKVFPIAGLATIVDDKPIGEDRRLIVVQGIARVQIIEELQTQHLFRSVEIARLKEGDPLQVAPAALAKVRRLAFRLGDGLGIEKEKLAVALDGCVNSAAQVDLLASHLAPGPAHRYALLCECDPALRCTKLIGLLTRMLGDEDEPQEYSN